MRDASYGIWAGGLATLVRNGFWAASILAFFVLSPGLTEVSEYEMGWFRLGFELLPAGLVGVFFGAILAIHLSTISSHLNLGARLSAVTDRLGPCAGGGESHQPLRKQLEPRPAAGTGIL